MIKILRIFDDFNLPDELVELIPGQSFAHLGARADYVRHETTRKVPEPRLPPYSLRLDGLHPAGHTSQLHKHTRRLNTRTSPARFRASSSVKLVLVLFYTVWGAAPGPLGGALFVASHRSSRVLSLVIAVLPALRTHFQRLTQRQDARCYAKK